MMQKNLLFLLLAPGISMTAPSAQAQNARSIGQQAREILQANCAECHGGGKAVKGGFGFVLDRDQLIGRLLVTPGHANQSDLYLRIQQGEMPPPKAKQRPSAAELKILKTWIDAGAPAF